MGLYSKGIWMGMEGNSAIVKADRGTLKGMFNRFNGGAVVKAFKPASSSGQSTVSDFENEVCVLRLLEAHAASLPFKIPRILAAEKATNSDDDAPVAYIRMTRLPNSLAGVEIADLAVEMKQAHVRAAAKALARLHALELSAEEKASIPCSPLDFNLAWLKTHDRTATDREKAHLLSDALQGMTGTPVFIHNDFHHRNLFADSYGASITGVCDFCCSGMGPREMDFYPFLNDPAVESVFLDAYHQESGCVPNADNLAVIRALRGFIGHYQAVPIPDRAPKQLTR